MGSGQSVTWNCEADSLAGTGEKAVISDPIEGVDADKFWKVFTELLMNRELGKFELSYEAKTLPDGSILSDVTLDASMLLGAGTVIHTYTVHKLDLANDEVIILNYGSDEKLSEKHLQFTSKVKVWRDPFRIEYQSVEHTVRRSGPFILAGLKDILTGMGTKAQAHQDAASPSEPGAMSVVSDPIEDISVTADTALDWFVEQSQAQLGGVLQPDGSIVEEVSKFMGMWVTYRRHTVDKANDQMVTLEYGTDSTMTVVVADTFLKVHRNPFRLECWSVSRGGVRAGEPAKKVIETLTLAILKKMAE